MQTLLFLVGKTIVKRELWAYYRNRKWEAKDFEKVYHLLQAQKKERRLHSKRLWGEMKHSDFHVEYLSCLLQHFSWNSAYFSTKNIMSFHLRSYFESKPLMIIALSSNHSRKQGKVFKSTATAISWIYFLLGSAIDAKYIEKKTKSVYNQGEGTYISGFWLPQNPKMSFLHGFVVLSNIFQIWASKYHAHLFNRAFFFFFSSSSSSLEFLFQPVVMTCWLTRQLFLFLF